MEAHRALHKACGVIRRSLFCCANSSTRRFAASRKMTRVDQKGLIVSSDQEKFLDEALKQVKQEAFEMKRCLDKNELMDALKHASQMLSELRTSALLPKYYYRLYIDVTNELQHLETALLDEFEKGRRVTDLYELVQYAGNIIPRLYLLITVGVIYIKRGEASRRDLLKDLVEMCRGVQHPLRGLFLRNYLLQTTRNLLPDAPLTCFDESEGNVSDSIDFIMSNFAEMNKLWVRMQHQGPSREKEKREKERMELRILVGTNLVRLSQLQNVDVELYRKTILPGILEQSVSCKDPISQEYLMECIIQVFPDEFHLATLDEFLEACAELHQGVQIKNVLSALIDRLALYATSDDGPGIPETIQLFDIFSRQAAQVIHSREDMAPEHIVALQTALVNLAIRCYPDRTDFANTVFESTHKIFTKGNITSIPAHNNVGRELLKMLRIPLEHYNDVIRLMELTDYAKVLQSLNYRGRTQAAAFVITNMLENDTLITEVDQVEQLFDLLNTLLVDQEDQPKDLGSDEDFIDEQHLVARLISLFHNDSVDAHFLLLSTVRKTLGSGGAHRIKYTLPALVFACYRLLMRYAEQRDLDKWEAKLSKMFVFCMNTITALITTSELSDLPLRLYLAGAVVADKISFDKSSTVTYEFISKAFSVYEEEISDSKAQLTAIQLLIGTIQQVRSLTDENHEPLRNQCALAASRLFKKADQSRAVCLVAHLYWTAQIANTEGPLRDGKRVADCLKKALKVASQCMEDSVQVNLYTNVLNNYVYFYEEGCEEITIDILNQLISKIRDCLMQFDQTCDSESVKDNFTNILEHIRNVKEENTGFATYEGIIL
ncbi:hypothetical protein QR680_001438 [Steinernema hermaphroditum]|uniref:Vacuolar protein sorting-associated protein 35 n=1 Tax=Steinernema hermaphroditum TaxID=289476 RepID=A0AA39LFH2_9BILA|nr:hypothetical protein QR680_001438 [Steinernema hermaphroditum]